MTGHVIRTHKVTHDPFARVPKNVLNDKDMSWEAKGMLAYLIGKPDDWTIMFNDLVNRSPCGPERTRRILKELEVKGYVQRSRKKTKEGKFYWESKVFDQPYWIVEEMLRLTE